MGCAHHNPSRLGGHSPPYIWMNGTVEVEAREKIDAVSASKTKLKSVEDVIMANYQLGRE